MQIHDPALLTEAWERPEEGEWTTDGHYYLFTYLGMLMGLDYDTAEQYGRWAEEPDTHVVTDEDISRGSVVMGNNVTVHLADSVKTGDMLENTTWMVGGLQQRYHALTGGFHGVELAATAYALTHATELGMEDDVKRYLLHRFGDCFAHFDISNDANL